VTARASLFWPIAVEYSQAQLLDKLATAGRRESNPDMGHRICPLTRPLRTSRHSFRFDQQHGDYERDDRCTALVARPGGLRNLPSGAGRPARPDAITSIMGRTKG